MSQPELPTDPQSTPDDVPVDWDAVEGAAAEAGCVAFHRKRDDEMDDEIRREVIDKLVNDILTAAESFCGSVDSRPAFIESVIHVLREEMAK